MNAAITAEHVWEALKQVMDPEIPVVSVVDMGIVRGVTCEAGGVQVVMTPTFSGCPALKVMQEEIKTAVQQLGVADVTITVQLAPAWRSDWITPQAREQLAAYGIAPPRQGEAGEEQLIQLSEPPLPCPRCQSLHTSVKNSFGPTLCKSIHYCHTCNEPFEGFKTVVVA